jgi:peptide/nickel transport system substrate-binding protein
MGLSRRKFLKVSAATATAATWPALLAACTEAAEAPGEGGQAAAGGERAETVIFDIDGGRVEAPENWNPLLPQARRDHGLHQAMAEPLFMLNYESGEIEPWLAEEMTSNESLDVWTLRLREGVTWSDGETFDADDVVFTVETMVEGGAEIGDVTGIIAFIDSVEKVDDLTVRFNLNKPNPRFQLDHFAVRIWGSVIVLPEHIWSGQDALTFKNFDLEQGWPVFTGPYRLASVSPTEFSYERNDDWWGAASGFQEMPAPRKLVWTWAGPEETRAARMAEGQLDSLMDITLGAFEAMQAQNPNVIAWKTDLPFAWLDPCARNIELNNTVEPWNDKEMRWALNYAIDREQIVEIAYEGTTIPSESIFPAYEPLNRLIDLAKEAGLYDKYPLTQHDPDRAREIIESKGYSLSGDYYERDGTQLSLDIQNSEAYIEKQRIAQVVVEQLQALGINATARNVADTTWQENFQLGEFEARGGWQTCGSVNEPWFSLDTLSNRWLKPVGERAEFNGWRWDNDEFSRIVDELGTLALDDPRVDDLFLQAWEIFLDELPILPVTQAKKLIPFDTTYWTGWPTEDDNYIHPTTWWNMTHKIIHNLRPA